MSKANEFRQQTEEFWSKMDQKEKVVATDTKATPTSSGNTLKKISVVETARRAPARQVLQRRAPKKAGKSSAGHRKAG